MLLYVPYVILNLLLCLAYVGIMGLYIKTWSALPVYTLPKKFQPDTQVTILVPARNEASQIRACIESILQQDFPSHLFELIIIDDHSTDETAAIVNSIQHPNLRLLTLADYIDEHIAIRSFKKKAIEIGIEQAKGDLIVTTDADCVVPNKWLAYIVAYYEETASRFIAAPVNFYQEQNLLERFQSLDFMGMMGITGAGINRRFMYMCNGANLAYEKKSFYAVGGFEGIDQLASGDDMLLMEKFAAHFPNAIGFIKNKAVRTLTKAQPNWSAFLAQRIRWASKSHAYQKWQVTLILALVFLFCVNTMISMILAVFWGSAFAILFCLQLLVKAIVDFIFLRQMSHFFDRSDLMKHFIPAQVLHILYIVIIGILANTSKSYQWKGRSLR